MADDTEDAPPPQRECVVCCGDQVDGPACPYCHRNGACKACWRTWLQQHPDNPVCPVTATNAQGGRTCNRTLTSAFIREAMGQKWFEDVWAGIRSEQLFLLEQTHLPTLQPLAAKYKELIDKRRTLVGTDAQGTDAQGTTTNDPGDSSSSSDIDEGDMERQPRSYAAPSSRRKARGGDSTGASGSRSGLTPEERRMREVSRARIADAVARVKECARVAKKAKAALDQARKAEQDLRAEDHLILAPPSQLCDLALEALPHTQRYRMPSLFDARMVLAGTAAARQERRVLGATTQGADDPPPAVLINCPSQGCRGYLRAMGPHAANNLPPGSSTSRAGATSSAAAAAGTEFADGAHLQCEMCKAVVCPKCQVLVRGGEAALEGGSLDGHVCDKETLASLAAIRRDSKPCPWPDCGAPTHRVSGCDQMWCVKCRRPWDWRSGRALHNPQYLHNPHYAEHMRLQQYQADNGGAAPARAGAGPPEAACMTNGQVYAYLHQHARAWGARVRALAEMRDFVTRHGCFTQTVKPDVSEAGALRDRVRYLAGELDEQTYRRNVYLRDRRCHALAATSDIVVSTTLAAYDIARAWIQKHREGTASVDDLDTDMTRLRVRVNQDLRNNARLHGTGDYQLDAQTWKLRTAKGLPGGKKRSGRTNAEVDEPTAAKRPKVAASAAQSGQAPPASPAPPARDDDDDTIVISSDSDE